MSRRISSTNLANDELRFWPFDIYKACIVAKTWLAFYYRYSMSTVFRIELATSWRTTMRQTIPASILSTTASPTDDGQTTEETSTPLRWPHNQPLRTCIHHGQGCRKDSQGNGRSDAGRRSKEDWRALEKTWST